MKKTLFLFALLSLITCCNAQPERAMNKEILEVLKKNNFNLEIFELAFCLDEVLYIIENDSSYYKIWDARINQAFNNKVKEETRYVHSIEYELLKKMLNVNSSLKNEYPMAYLRIQQLEPALITKEYSNFAGVIKAYVEYPEQIDNICLIMLTCEINCNAFDDIHNDKIALWKFNNWIDYGFEEFRYYPGTLNKGKGSINNRIIDYIMKIRYCQGHPLVNNSVVMIKSIIEKY